MGSKLYRIGQASETVEVISSSSCDVACSKTIFYVINILMPKDDSMVVLLYAYLPATCATHDLLPFDIWHKSSPSCFSFATHKSSEDAK